MTAEFALSAFGDEIADDLSDQLALLRKLEIGYLELRGVWGKNVLALDEDEAQRVAHSCREAGIRVSAIGSPVGKSALTDSIDNELDNLLRIFRIADTVGTRIVRVFSFYPPDTTTNTNYDSYVGASAERLAALAKLAESEGFTLLLENEKEIVGDTIARCQALLKAVDSPSLRFAWDPANFVQVDEANATTRGWPLLGGYVAHVHVKDAVLDSGDVRAAGEGDGEVGLLLARLRDVGYQGMLALEPHLAIAGHSSGFSGVEGMTYAAETLRKLMADVGCKESLPEW
ncbi:MAG: sugar phosphate isomerase/epimerase family protein [Chloroflexota bacterium]|nr:sugar phosphate isomerase/epimerase family protein [Chloroflexota bacterium]